MSSLLSGCHFAKFTFYLNYYSYSRGFMVFRASKGHECVVVYPPPALRLFANVPPERVT